MSILERLGSWGGRTSRATELQQPPSMPQWRGNLDRLSELQHKIPVLYASQSQLPDDDVAQSIREGKRRRKEAQFDFTVFLSLSEPLIKLAEEGIVTLWYTPQQTPPAYVVDGQHSLEVVEQLVEQLYDGIHEDTVESYNDPRTAQRILREINELPSVRILPEEVRDLAKMINGCKKIVKESIPGTTLEELNLHSLHPVDIFLHFATRRGLILP